MGLPTQSHEDLSKRALGRSRDTQGRFADEPRPAEVDTSSSAPLSLTSPQDTAAAPIQLKGTLGRKNRKNKKPTKQQEELEQAIRRVFAVGGWREALKLRSRRGYHHYSAQNSLRINYHFRSKGIDDPLVASATDWEQKGRKIAAMQEGCAVVVPQFHKKTIEEEDEEGNTVEKVIRWTTYKKHENSKVFDISQTEQIPGVKDATNTTMWGEVTYGENVDPGKASIEMEQVIADAGLTLERVSPNTLNGALGSHSRETGVIRIDKTLEPADAVAVMAHELGHHFDRSLSKDPELYRKHRGDCETVAEMTAMSVAMELGIDTTGSSATYLQRWNPDWQPETIGWAKNVVERWTEAHTKIIKLLEKQTPASTDIAA